MTPSRPNFVFFFPDEMRAESLGCYGHSVVNTPNFNKLAAGGVLFEQCHVQNPVCSPSRCSVMTGLYPHVSGHRTLWHLLRPYEPSLFRYLKQEGYKIKWFGKNHLYSDEYLTEILGDDAYRIPEQMVREMRGAFNRRNPFSQDDPRYYSFLEEPTSGVSDLTETDINVQSAIDFLVSEEAKEGPFLLFLPLVMPHAPYVVPEPFYSMYNPSSLPPLKPVVETNKPSAHRLIRQYRHIEEIKDDTLERIQAVYLGMITHVDTLFGKMMDTLESSGLSESTTVIVSSDHGDYAGDYGLVEKWPNAMEDCLTRVPLIFRVPGNAEGHRISEQVESFDIMPTILELAGIEAKHDHFAQSIVPQIYGAAGDKERTIYAEGGYNSREPHCFEGDSIRDAWFANNPQSIYWPKARQQQEHPESVCRSTMMRTLQHKLIMRSSGENELYDLKKDPNELQNVYDDAEYSNVRLGMERHLLNWYIETSDIVSRENDRGMFVTHPSSCQCGTN